jgi:hypothetical protein
MVQNVNCLRKLYHLIITIGDAFTIPLHTQVQWGSFAKLAKRIDVYRFLLTFCRAINEVVGLDMI